MEIKEGYMPFMGYQTYYRIVGWHARHHLSDREASKGREVSHPQQYPFEQQIVGE